MLCLRPLTSALNQNKQNRRKKSPDFKKNSKFLVQNVKVDQNLEGEEYVKGGKKVRQKCIDSAALDPSSTTTA